jgi:hypothetical protein
MEHCNRLGNKDKFGFPTQMAMDAIGVSRYETYIKYFNDLCQFGFFELVQKSKNQYSANIISLNTAILKSSKALDRAIVKQSVKLRESNAESNPESGVDSDSSIDKPITNNHDVPTAHQISEKTPLSDFQKANHKSFAKRLLTDEDEAESRSIICTDNTITKIPEAVLDNFNSQLIMDRKVHLTAQAYIGHFRNWVKKGDNINPKTKLTKNTLSHDELYGGVGFVPDPKFKR